MLCNFTYAVAAATGIPVKDQLELTGKYTDGTTKSKAPEFTLKQVAQVIISAAEGSATLKHDEACDLADQILVDSLYTSDWYDRSFKETFEHFVKLDNAGKKFCNFFANLGCEHDPKAPVFSHRCLCPHRMIWQDKENRCVFKIGEQCDGDDISGYQDKNKPFPVFDFVNQDFTRHILSNCEGKSRCRHGESNTCLMDDDFDHLASPSELAAFLASSIGKSMSYNNIIHIPTIRHN